MPVLATACGGSDAARKQARVECETRAENEAAYEVARSAFNAGTLGGARSLASFFGSLPRSAYLDGSGRLRPWSAIQQRTRVRFGAEEWVGHLEASGAPIGARLHNARLRVRSTNAAHC